MLQKKNTGKKNRKALLLFFLASLGSAVILTAVNGSRPNLYRTDSSTFTLVRYLFKSQPLYKKTSRGFIRTNKWMSPCRFAALRRITHKFRPNFLQISHRKNLWIKEAYTSAASLIRGGKDLTIGSERVDYWYALGPDYIPRDLVTLPRKYCKFRKVKMRRKAAAAFLRLVKAAAEKGIRIYAFSGYRAYSVQRMLYLRRIRIGRKLKQKAVARPGHSEHQLGTTVDVVGSDTSLAARSAFARTPQAKWLRKHCYDFGFVLSYGPDNKTPTGYITETWHIRYIGRKNIDRWKRAHL